MYGIKVGNLTVLFPVEIYSVHFTGQINTPKISIVFKRNPTSDS